MQQHLWGCNCGKLKLTKNSSLLAYSFLKFLPKDPNVQKRGMTAGEFTSHFTNTRQNKLRKGKGLSGVLCLGGHCGRAGLIGLAPLMLRESNMISISTNGALSPLSAPSLRTT